MNRKPIFTAVRELLGRGFTSAEVTKLDEAINAAIRSLLVEHEAKPDLAINKAGINLIKEFEGLRLKAYRCPAGKPTIGFGTTKGVKMGDTITEADAEELLRLDLDEFEEGVAKLIGDAPTTSNQFSAMVSLAYNVGLGNFGGSTLLKLHNAGDYAAAANEFRKWKYAGGKVLKGLVRRREAERHLYRGEYA